MSLTSCEKVLPEVNPDRSQTNADLKHLLRSMSGSESNLTESPQTDPSRSSPADLIRAYVAYSTPKKNKKPNAIRTEPLQPKLEFKENDSQKKNYTQSRKQMLISSIRKTKYNSPTKKEIEEAYAFSNATRTYYGTKSFDCILDVAGGHGAVAALLLMSTCAKEAVVIDPAHCSAGVQGIASGWGHMFENKILRYRHQELENCLLEEIHLLQNKYGISSNRILVVACHACQYLTTDTMEIARQEGVNVCVMPCCQKDTTGGSVKAFSKALDTDVGIVMDIMAAGKMTNYYDVKLKLVDKVITPQNRMIMCKVKKEKRKEIDYVARARLKAAYTAAHKMGTGVDLALSTIQHTDNKHKAQWVHSELSALPCEEVSCKERKLAETEDSHHSRGYSVSLGVTITASVVSAVLGVGVTAILMLKYRSV